MNSALIYLAALGALAAITAAPGVASADEAEAKKHLDRAVEYYKYKRYSSAAIEFARAYQEDPSPRTLFAWAQSERLADRCTKAIDLYNQFLAKKPPRSQVEAAMLGLEKCRQKLVEKEAARREAEAKARTSRDTQPDPRDPSRNDGSGKPADTDEPKDTERGRRNRRNLPDGGGGGPIVTGDGAEPSDGGPEPWYYDRAAGITTGTGAVLVILSLPLYLSARSLASGAAENADNEEEFEDIQASARSRRNYAVLLAISGAALGAFGLYRYYTLRNAEGQSVTVTPAVTGDGAGVFLYGRF